MTYACRSLNGGIEQGMGSSLPKGGSPSGPDVVLVVSSSAACNLLRMLREFLMASIFLGVSSAASQEAEPRSYSNAPVGLNFLIAGFAHSEGKLAFDPSLSIADA